MRSYVGCAKKVELLCDFEITQCFPKTVDSISLYQNPKEINNALLNHSSVFHCLSHNVSMTSAHAHTHSSLIV